MMSLELVRIEEYKLKLDLQLSWGEPRLAFGWEAPKARHNSSIVLRSADSRLLWIPDIYFVNEKKNFAEAPSGFAAQEQMKIYADGRIRYTIRLNLKLACDMRLEKYPMDTQKCSIIMGSYSYTSKELRLDWQDLQPLNLDPDLNLPKFRMESHYTEPCAAIKSGDQAESYSCLRALLVMKREFSFHLIQTFFPSILLVLSSWVAFFIDPAAVPARVSIGVTTLLTIVSMLVAVRVGLPPVSYIKAIDVWMFMCILYIFGALIEFAIMNHAQTRFKNNQKLFGKSTCCGGGKEEELRDELEKIKIAVVSDVVSTNSTIQLSEDGSVRGKPRGPVRRSAPPPPPVAPMPTSMNIDRLARFAFPITFGLFNVVYWSYFGT